MGRQGKGARQDRFHGKPCGFERVVTGNRLARDVIAQNPRKQKMEFQRAIGGVTDQIDIVEITAGVAITPVSSASSRTAAASAVSPGSTWPPGKPHSPASGGLRRRASST